MITFLTIAGGVALILFGVRFMRKGLDRVFGKQLGPWMQRLGDNRIKSFFTGIGVAIAAPSSTTVSVLAVQTVQAGHMTARQMLALMFGADIGLTVTVMLIALNLYDYAPIVTLAGFSLYRFGRSSRTRGLGRIILSFGFIFIGVGIIKNAATVVNNGDQASNDLTTLLEIATRYPIGLVCLAAVVTIIFQSSTATIALVIGLGAASAVSLQAAVAVVIGANVGIVITTLIVGWRQLESRRLAMGNLIAKLIVAVAVLCAMKLRPDIIDQLGKTPGDLANHVAYAHTGFNVLMALLMLPLITPITKVVEKILPTPPPTETKKFGPRHINVGPLDGALAYGQSQREIMRVAEIVRSMLNDTWTALRNGDVRLVDEVSERDDQVDLLDHEIKHFVTSLGGSELDADDAAEQMHQLRYLNQLETTGDIIDKNMTELVRKKIRKNVRFSDEGFNDIDSLFGKVTENLLIAETAFATRDRMLAQQLIRHKEQINQLERELRDRHFARLQSGQTESHETSAIHLDLLTHLKHINSCVTHVAYAIVEERNEDNA